MKPETCERITLDTYLKYGNRKKDGRISFFVDTRNDSVYLVPRDIEHIEFVKYIAKLHDYSRIIPTHVDTELHGDELFVIGILTGVSGLEIKLNVRHSHEDLEIAHDVTWNLINSSDVKVGKLRENRIVTWYGTREDSYSE